MLGKDKYFDLPARQYCGLYLEKRLASRVNSLLQKQAAELVELIGANLDEAHVADFTIIKDEEHHVVRYVRESDNSRHEKQHRLELYLQGSKIRPLEHVIFVDESDWQKAKETAQQEYRKYFCSDVEEHLTES